ncbi:zinc-binding dehydrogenase [Sphaerotilus mobilis]|uniref:NADPH:quinone reductase-like Zn-dependent oxidoreductase n=1 Tax=Sphaerotilus mobilis TaxID=47994 RepID=A0A4V2EWV1_9BURK|nr:zinc-binding dehydrogenase [Sphaerotilus mobilis]RZS57270.1 NADPH:quinone reductase-like Zn-dependent oxidoreductase [Sphaerotilus mobilis]
MTTTMQAAWLTGHGGNEVVQIGTRERPVRAAGEVLVRMKAATLNRVDLYMRDSGAGITHPLPLVMGVDGAGVVEDVGPEETRWQVGQRVVLQPIVSCGRCEFCERGDTPLCTSASYLGEHRHGTLAQFVSLPARNVFALPEGLDFAQGAALGVNHLTAWRMLFTKARVQPWETVLIFGIGGGVSLAALQLVKAIGAKAIVTSRDAGKLERARAHGADEVVLGAGDEIAKQVLKLTGGRGVDVVIENIGTAVWSAALKSLVRGGRLVTCGATSGDQPGADIRRLFIRQLQVIGSTAGSLNEFRDLLTFVAQHKLQPVIDQTYPLAELHAALDHLDASRQFGKVAVALPD